VSDRTQPLPRGLRTLALVAAALLLLPLLGLWSRAPWSEIVTQATQPAVLDALWLSLGCSAAATACTAVLGLPLALWLAGPPSAARTAVRVLVTLPMVLPPVVGGVALLFAFGRNGLVGAPLADWFGVSLPFTEAGVVLAEAYIALPFFVLAAEGGFRAMDRRYVEAAATLGASPWRTLLTVTLPIAAPSLRAGLLLAWARALGEFGATITFAGNLVGRTRTMPLEVYAALESSPEAASVLSILLVLLSGGVLFALRHHWFPVR
jgi:molybdate transport system permease protein